MAREMSKLEDEINRETSPRGPELSGVFFDEGTDADFEEYDRLENKGWKGFYKKIANLGKKQHATNKE